MGLYTKGALKNTPKVKEILKGREHGYIDYYFLWSREVIPEKAYFYLLLRGLMRSGWYRGLTKKIEGAGLYNVQRKYNPQSN